MTYFSHFADIFGDFSFNRTETGPERGADLKYSLTIPFMDAVFGSEKKIQIQRSENCEVCHGTGAKPGTKPITCPECSGRGVVSQGGRQVWILQCCDNMQTMWWNRKDRYKSMRRLLWKMGLP